MSYGPFVRNAIGLLATLMTAAGPVLAHTGIVPPLAGFAVFALGGLGALVTGVASVVQGVRGRRVGAGGALAIVTGLVVVAIGARGAGNPRINDFTTDPGDPPVLTFAATLPANAGRDLSYPPGFAAVQATCCGDLHPARIATSPEEAFRRALAVALRRPDWHVTHADAAAGTIEAVATTPVFRFQDDVAIRVRPDRAGGARVDVRSKSRDGKGDVGANTARIREFVAAVEAAGATGPAR